MGKRAKTNPAQAKLTHISPWAATQLATVAEPPFKFWFFFRLDDQ